MILLDLQHHDLSQIGDISIDEDHSGWSVSFDVDGDCLVVLSVEQARKLAAQFATIPEDLPGDRYAKHPQEITP